MLRPVYFKEDDQKPSGIAIAILILTAISTAVSIAALLYRIFGDRIKKTELDIDDYGYDYDDDFDDDDDADFIYDDDDEYDRAAIDAIYKSHGCTELK